MGRVGNLVPWRVQVFGGINCPLSSSPVYVSQYCVESSRPPYVSVQHESTELDGMLGESKLKRSQLGERTMGLLERSRTAPAALRTMKVKFEYSNLRCEGAYAGHRCG
jgi:hypothetical protein